MSGLQHQLELAHEVTELLSIVYNVSCEAATRGCQWEVTVSRRNSKKNLGSDVPKAGNEYVERRNLVEMVCLDFQNTFDNISLWKL